MSTSLIDEVVNFRARLIKERRDLGFSNQADFARAIQLSGKTYNHYETGKSEPGLTALLKMVALGVDLCYLMTGSRRVAAEQVARAHAQHVLALIDTVVSAELDQEDVEVLIPLIRKLAG